MARRKTSKPKVVEEEVQQPTIAKEKLQQPTIAKEKLQQPKAVKEKVQKPTQFTTTINCTINSSYIVDCPTIAYATITALLNDKPIEDIISNKGGKYKGIKLVKKNNKLIVYTGKHGLTSTEDTVSGVLTIQFMEI